MQTTLIHHAANRGNGYPSGSLAALKDCLSANVGWVEIDLIPLQGGDFALLHDANLVAVSNGSGAVPEKTAAEIQVLHYKDHPQYQLSTLSEVIRWVKEIDSDTHIQLDLKPFGPINAEVLKSLLRLVEPIKERVLVSTVADWVLRLLHRIDAEIRLGFDPLLYLDLETNHPRPEGIPPLRVGAYGLRDDHPLAVQRWGSEKDYFAARAEALLLQAPLRANWYINAGLLELAHEAGFDWIDFIHQYGGGQVAAWTLDADRIALTERLIDAGVDLVTTNQAAALSARLNGKLAL